MASTRGAFAQLIAPGLIDILFEELGQHPEEYSQFMEVETSDSAYDEDQMMGGLGLARLKQEGAQITYDDPIQGGTKRYIHDTYALGWQITREMIKDEKYGIMKKMPGELAKSCRQTYEQLGANGLNLSGSTITTANGVSLLNTAQPLLGGGTYSNRLSPDADFSVTALQDILILFENMVNERALKMQLSPSNLWFPPELQFTVAKALQSTFEPGTGNNDINPVQGRLQPAVLHFLTSTRNWFVSSKESNHLKFKWRERPVMDSVDDFETKGTKHSIMFRCSVGATEWRGWAGSRPG